MITQKTILKNIRIYKRRVGKSHCTSGDEFKVSLIRKDNGKKMTFSFYDSMDNNSGLERMLECLLIDRICYLDYKNYADFCYSFGYDYYDPKAKEAYNGCKKETTQLNNFFTRREIEVLTSYYVLTSCYC